MGLPTHTSGYALRLELGLVSTAHNILNLALNWLAKMLGMGEERFPRICLKRLQAAADSSAAAPKFNWILQVKHLLSFCEAEGLWLGLDLFASGATFFLDRSIGAFKMHANVNIE